MQYVICRKSPRAIAQSISVSKMAVDRNYHCLIEFGELGVAFVHA